ncbi:hypothetical protein PENDEC_c003G06798 [Penicillium decumbens]|uniref:SH3 domain-containing protein n=1 Tax=Penicillium decumbens TaxID=69771 RepID=A0A1V6PK08_PENDC|nr:hypothetical protein PENDEC_c003G06798 [Penicillium decumbens]
MEIGAMRRNLPGTRADFHLRQVAYFPLSFISPLSSCVPLQNLSISIKPRQAFLNGILIQMASEITSAMTARSLRIIRNELEFLVDTSVITSSQLNSILSQLPDETDAHAAVARQEPRQTSLMQQPAPSPSPLPEPVQAQPPPAPYSPPTTQMSNVSFNEKAQLHNQYVSPSPQPPPAYPQVPPILSLATALYAYTPTDPGDLAMSPNDRIQVTEHMNDDWWRGRNERTGMEGIFPRAYVNVIDEKAAAAMAPPQANYAPPQSNYGNMPLDVSQSGSSANPNDPDHKNKFEQGGKKFGKKLGNAAIFGAGATVGSNIVNSIF